MPSPNVDLNDLARRLKQEKLFVANERKEIESLNRKVQLLSTGLLHQTWLTGQHRLALENLSRGAVMSPFSCLFVVEGGGDVIENLELVEAHKLISPRYLQSFIDVITLLRSHPDVVGLCISNYESDKNNSLRHATNQPSFSINDVLQALINVYGGIGGPLPSDAILHLKLLSVLAGYQLVGSETPRRVLRHGSCAFSILWHLISETIPSSRLFLVGALHQPVTQLLSSQELLCLETNHSTMSPVSMVDVQNSFSNPTTNGDIASLDRTEKLARLTKLFIDSILDNIHTFPTGLAWLIKSIHSQLSSKHPEKEVSAICTDLIWALFICPAVTNPEPFGVTDAPVSSQARHTLSQVATNLQALALYRWEGTDPRLSEFISYLDPEALTSVLDHVLNMEGGATEQTGIVSSLLRRTILIPENLMQPLFTWLKECIVMLEHNGKSTEIEIWPALVKSITTVNENYSKALSSGNSIVSANAPSSVSGSNASLSSSPSHSSSILANGKRVLLNKKADSRQAQSTLNSPAGIGHADAGVSVIVFPITQQSWEWVGMLPESEVISKQGKAAVNVVPYVDSIGGMDDPEDEERDDRISLGEKRTRFSLSNDEGSIGKVDWDFENHVFLHCNYRDGKVVKLTGTSDNLEAVSEAASTHSVSSSIELEDQNDNFSDMLSANVSGRGTPNVSGRNTPLSQAEQEEENNANQEMDDDIIMDEAQNEPPPNINPPNLNNLNINGPEPSKQARSEIEDKFCKFEIKKLFGEDETVSLVSDTWSTDVLASDSEMGGDAQHALPLPNQIIPRNPVVPGSVNNSDLPPAAPVAQDSNANNETMSEAWSTDVAANDIERLNDFDTDDTASVARSDETGRSEPEVMAYDTPRSSVSGGGTYRRPDQERDLLMFDEVQPESNASALPPPPVENEVCSMDIPIESESSTSFAGLPLPLSAEPLLEVPASSPGTTVSELVSPTSSQISMSVSPHSLQTPGSSTRSGAIPKTISFDKTAERGDKENWDDESGRTRRFFRNFRLPFRGRSRKSTRGHDERVTEWDRMPDTNTSLPVPKFRKSLSEDVGAPSTANQVMNEASDEILAKYRRKPSLTDSTGSPVLPPRSEMVNLKLNSLGNGSAPIIRKDSLKITKAELVNEARRKLRNVLSNCDLQHTQTAEGNSLDCAVVNLLRVEMASAISRADQITAAQLQEAVRTVKLLGADGCRKVLRLLRDDYRRRSDYISYLMRAKQGLLSTIKFLERATVRAKHEGDTYSHYLITECIRLWLEEQSQSHFVDEFTGEFRQSTTVDEKIELLEGFLYTLMDLFIGSKELTEWQLGKAEKALEQYIVARVYTHALYPNGEADMHRDMVLRDHISRLETVITPSHRDLKIPKSQLGEYPWPAAQQELRMLSAYKTASDKLRCIIRAASLIVSLLSSGSEKVVAADDFVPVLVFVIIKSNPAAILSTIQYVNSFCGQKISGEDQYWWTQFCSAVEFIKTMDYNE